MKNKKMKYIGIAIAVVVLLIVGVFAVKILFPTTNAAIEIANVMKPFINAENKSMHLVIDAGIDQKELQLETDVYAVREETTDYLVLKSEDATFYVVDDLLLLENGKAFLLTEEKEDSQAQITNYMDMFPLLVTAFDEFEIRRTEENESVYYQIEVTGEQMKDIMDIVMSSYAEIGEAVEGLQIQLVTQNGNLDKIELTGTGVSNATQVSCSVVLSNFELLEKGEYEISQIIKDSVKNVNRETLFCLTEDLYRLIKAVEPLSDMNNLQGTMNWQVSCGLIQINTSMDLKELSSLKTEGSNKDDISSAENETEIATKLIELIGAMIMEGEIRCSEQEEIYVYELTIDDTVMKQLVGTMAPEIISYAVDFEKGSMKLEVKGEALSEITIGIEGSIKILLSNVPMQIGVTFDFAE